MKVPAVLHHWLPCNWQVSPSGEGALIRWSSDTVPNCWPRISSPLLRVFPLVSRFFWRSRCFARIWLHQPIGCEQGVTTYSSIPTSLESVDEGPNIFANSSFSAFMSSMSSWLMWSSVMAMSRWCHQKSTKQAPKELPFFDPWTGADGFGANVDGIGGSGFDSGTDTCGGFVSSMSTALSTSPSCWDNAKTICSSVKPSRIDWTCFTF